MIWNETHEDRIWVVCQIMPILLLLEWFSLFTFYDLQKWLIDWLNVCLATTDIMASSRDSNERGKGVCGMIN